MGRGFSSESSEESTQSLTRSYKFYSAKRSIDLKDDVLVTFLVDPFGQVTEFYVQLFSEQSDTQ